MSVSRRQFLVAGAAFAAGCATSSHAKAESEAMEIPASENVNPFAASLYGELRTKAGNAFLSPSSIHTALAMTAAGAKGATLKQMATLLHLPAKPGKEFASKDVELAIANALWAQNGYPWSKEYMATVTKTFHAAIHDTDYSKPEAARSTINRWVETRTKDKIKDLLPKDSITAATRLVLTNAIYFKGDWLTAFDKKRTQDAPFTALDGVKKNVPLMHRSGTIDFVQNEQFQAIRLPYKGKEISMIAVMPTDPAKFTDLDKSLSVETLAKWTGGLKPTSDLSLWLPRFKIETEYNLNDPLKKLGMTDAFATRADFTGMVSTPSERLYISLVIHKAYVDVNEEGTEAAAATGVVMARKSAVAKPKIFRADRPFLFALRHEPTGTILFLGRYTNP